MRCGVDELLEYPLHHYAVLMRHLAEEDLPEIVGVIPYGSEQSSRAEGGEREVARSGVVIAQLPRDESTLFHPADQMRSAALLPAEPSRKSPDPQMIRGLADSGQGAVLGSTDVAPPSKATVDLSARHALVIEHALRPLFGFFQADTLPVGFYANAGDFDGTTVLNSEVYSRIDVGLNDVLPRLTLRADAVPDSRPLSPTPVVS